MSRISIKLVLLILLYGGMEATAGARLVSMRGDVKVRRGLDEAWQSAGPGILLEDMDSILNGEAAEALLEMEDGRAFRLGGNSILDIADLRRISEQQLFLYLTAKKIRNLEPAQNSEPIRIQNVSAVRADDRSKSGTKVSTADNLVWKQETNAALAMIEQAFYPNAVVKVHKIMDAHAAADKSRLYFYLGRSFEALQDNGRALEAYQAAIAHLKNGKTEIQTEAEQAVRRLKNQ